MSITGCVLAKNEERLLQGCLASLSKFVDEIIVVDNGSSDDTAGVAKRFGCKVIFSPDTVIDEGRNAYLDAAKTDWVFVLDTDERVSAKYSSKIHKIANEAPSEVMQLKFDKFNYFGRGRFSLQNATSRFFRVKPFLRYSHVPVHATIEAGLTANGGKTQFIDICIQHYDALIPGRSTAKRTSYYNELAKHATADQPVFQYFGYATEAAVEQEYEKAFSLYEFVYNNDAAPKRIRDHSLGSAAQLALYLGDDDRLERLLSKFRSVQNLTNREVLFTLEAAAAARRGDIDGAITYCNRALKENEDVDILLDMASLTDERCPDTAISCIQRALALNDNLLNPSIYTKCDAQNTYQYQSLFLDTYRDCAYHMARSYHSLGDEDRARQWMEKSDKLWACGSVYDTIDNVCAEDL